MRIRISGRQCDNFGMLSSGSVTGWGGWHSRQRWHQLCSPLSALVRWMCTCSFQSPPCLRILCSAILARKVAGRVVLMNHSWVSLYRSLLLIVPRTLNTPLLLSWDLSVRFLNEIFCFLYCGAQKPCLVLLAIFNARHMLDCSSYTQPPCLAIVADMLKTYKTLVAASNYEIWVLPLLYILP